MEEETEGGREGIKKWKRDTGKEVGREGFRPVEVLVPYLHIG